MGATISSWKEERLRHQKHAARLEKRRIQEADPNLAKVLMLGTGESGKSTFFRQIIRLCDGEFDKVLRENCTSIIIQNIAFGTCRLLNQVEKEGLALIHENQENAKFILEEEKQLMRSSDFKKYVVQLKALWNDPAMKEAYERRANLQIADSISYFLDKIQEFGDEKYLPSDEDILEMRLRTAGILDEIFEVNGYNIKVVDGYMHLKTSTTSFISVQCQNMTSSALKMIRRIEFLNLWSALNR
jgi:GTPase SAR1 family protein